VALVAELLPEDEPEFTDLVEVLGIADAGQIPLIKSILEAEEIPYLAQGENFNLARNIPVRFLVPKKYLVQARDVLVDFPLADSEILNGARSIDCDHKSATKVCSNEDMQERRSHANRFMSLWRCSI